MLKNVSKQSDYDNIYQLVNGKVIKKTLTINIVFTDPYLNFFVIV